MKSKTSLVNSAILRNDLKSNAWVSIVYLLGLLFTVPISIYFMYIDSLNYFYSPVNYSRILAFDNFSGLFIMVIPVLAGLLLLRYLQTGKAADMLHSLPIKRETHYNTHILAGLFILFVPLLVTALVTWIIVAALPINIAGGEIVVWLGLSLLMSLLFFMTSVAVGMFTGMTSVQGVLSYILLFLPTGLSVLLLENLRVFTYGFAADYYSSAIEISPLLRMTDFWYYPIQTGEIIAYILVCILLYVLGRYFYLHRQLEKAGDALTFDALLPLFKYGVTLCGMLLLGAYIYSRTGGLGWLFFAYLLGSLLAYLLVLILFKKSIYVFDFKNFKGYGIFAIAMVVMIAALHFDFIGFEKKVPAPDEIECVYMDYSFGALTYMPSRFAHNSNNPIPYPATKPIYKDGENVKSIQALHQSIISNHKQDKTASANNLARYGAYEKVSLAYTLKNGAHIYRQYTISPDKYRDNLAALYESQEYKNYHHNILRVNAADVNLIEIQASQINRIVNISDPEQIQAAVKILQDEVLHQSYAEMTDSRDTWAHISVYTNDRHVIYLSWRKSFADFENWLKTDSRYSLARINAERDLSHAVIIKNIREPEKKEAARSETVRSDQTLSEWENTPDNVKISNSHQLEECLQKYVRDDKQDYRILFVLKDGGMFEGFLAKDDLPESI